ncbi:MAG: hypothetical protein HYY18_17230 [Planctomycetes bacterium]|nr:hypothetical protein [Planctomycetota bacterium]
MTRKWTLLALLLGAAAPLAAIVCLRTWTQPFDEVVFRGKARWMAKRTPRMPREAPREDTRWSIEALRWEDYQVARDHPIEDGFSRQAWSTPAHFRILLSLIHEAPTPDERDRLLGLLVDWPHWQTDRAFLNKMAALMLTSPDPYVREAAGTAVERALHWDGYRSWEASPLEPDAARTIVQATLRDPDEGTPFESTRRLFRIAARFTRLIPETEAAWWELALDPTRPSVLRELALNCCDFRRRKSSDPFVFFMDLFDSERDPEMRWRWFSTAFRYSRKYPIMVEPDRPTPSRERFLTAARKMIVEANRGDRRAFALYTLSERAEDSLRSLCLDLTARDPAPEVRARALAILHERYLDGEVLRLNLEALLRDPAPTVRLQVVRLFKEDLRTHGPRETFRKSHFQPPLRQARQEATLDALETAAARDPDARVRSLAKVAMFTEGSRYRPDRFRWDWLGAAAALVLLVGAAAGFRRVLPRGLDLRSPSFRRMAACAGVLALIAAAAAWRYKVVTAPQPFSEVEFRAQAKRLIATRPAEWEPNAIYSEVQPGPVYDYDLEIHRFAYEAWDSPERLRILIAMCNEGRTIEEKAAHWSLINFWHRFHWCPDDDFVREMANLCMTSPDGAVRLLAGRVVAARGTVGPVQGWEESRLDEPTVARMEEYMTAAGGEDDRRDEMAVLNAILDRYRYLRPSLEDRWAAIALDSGRPGWLRAFALRQFRLESHIVQPVHRFALDVLAMDPSPDVRHVGYEFAWAKWPRKSGNLETTEPGFDRLVAANLNAARTESSEATRAAALWRLREFGLPGLREVCFERLPHESSRRVRSEIWRCLWNLEDPDGRILDLAISWLVTSLEWRERWSALFYLIHRRLPSVHDSHRSTVLAAIRRAAREDPNPWIRREATKIVGPEPVPPTPGQSFTLLGLTADRRDVVCVGLILALAAAALILTRRSQ